MSTGALIGPNHGEAGIGSTSETGRDPITGERYATDRQLLEAVVADLAALRVKATQLSADLANIRTVQAGQRTLVNEMKADHNVLVSEVGLLVALSNATKAQHNALDAVTGSAHQVTQADVTLAGTENVVAADAAALAAGQDDGIVAVLQTRLAPRP